MRIGLRQNGQFSTSTAPVLHQRNIDRALVERSHPNEANLTNEFPDNKLKGLQTVCDYICFICLFLSKFLLNLNFYSKENY